MNPEDGCHLVQPLVKLPYLTTPSHKHVSPSLPHTRSACFPSRIAISTLDVTRPKLSTAVGGIGAIVEPRAVFATTSTGNADTTATSRCPALLSSVNSPTWTLIVARLAMTSSKKSYESLSQPSTHWRPLVRSSQQPPSLLPCGPPALPRTKNRHEGASWQASAHVSASIIWSEPPCSSLSSALLHSTFVFTRRNFRLDGTDSFDSCTVMSQLSAPPASLPTFLRQLA